jgi:hypothetical protein
MKMLNPVYVKPASELEVGEVVLNDDGELLARVSDDENYIYLERIAFLSGDRFIAAERIRYNYHPETLLNTLAGILHKRLT